MKCHYEVLDIAREASAAEIKTAYRRLALQWHPDKNPDNLQEAKEQFQAIQNAYEVLSDPQERAWYDNHREQLLRGAGSSYNDSSLDVFPYFSPSCYKGFGDDKQGFYAVYSEVFSKLAAEETDFLDDPEDVNKIPGFGISTSEYELVHEFYAYWMSYSTRKSYVWLDQHQVSQGDNRRVIKIIEKENNKVRQKARRERNEEVRRLASFVRRRDPRVREHTRILQEKAQQNKLKAEQVRRERILERQRQMAAAAARHAETTFLHDQDYARRLAEVETQLQETFGVSSDEASTDCEDSSDEDTSHSPDVKATSVNKPRALYCSACNKLFKNIRSFENHERSRKHRDNVAALGLDLPSVSDPDQNAAGADQTEDPPAADGEAGGVTVAGDVSTPSDCAEAEATRSDDSAPVENTKKKKKKKRPAVRVESEGNDSHDEMSITELTPTPREGGEGGATRRRRRGKRGEASLTPPPPSPHACTVCGTTFPSNNKLFEHLKKTGHAVAKNQPEKGRKR